MLRVAQLPRRCSGAGLFKFLEADASAHFLDSVVKLCGLSILLSPCVDMILGHFSPF